MTNNNFRIVIAGKSENLPIYPDEQEIIEKKIEEILIERGINNFQTRCFEWTLI